MALYDDYGNAIPAKPYWSADQQSTFKKMQAELQEVLKKQEQSGFKTIAQQAYQGAQMGHFSSKDNEHRGMVVDSYITSSGYVKSGPKVIDTHTLQNCVGKPCTVHEPTEHHMREWPKRWNSEWGLLQRLCPHHVEHPDPDEILWRKNMGKKMGLGIKNHVCCPAGCCGPDTSSYMWKDSEEKPKANYAPMPPPPEDALAGDTWINPETGKYFVYTLTFGWQEASAPAQPTGSPFPGLSKAVQAGYKLWKVSDPFGFTFEAPNGDKGGPYPDEETLQAAVKNHQIDVMPLSEFQKPQPGLPWDNPSADPLADLKNAKKKYEADYYGYGYKPNKGNPF